MLNMACMKLKVIYDEKVFYRQTFPEEGHGLKRLFHNGRQKTTILIGLFLMTSCF